MFHSLFHRSCPRLTDIPQIRQNQVWNVGYDGSLSLILIKIKQATWLNGLPVIEF